MRDYAKLGIIGGMGPAATVRLMQRIIDFTDVEADQDHLDVTALVRPWVPDRTAYLLGREGAASFVEPLQEAARQLQDAGCDYIAISCNTSHARLADIQSVLDHARIVDMLAETARLFAQLGCARVGVLATDGTLATGVYGRALEGQGLSWLAPDDDSQREVMSIIYDGVKAGRAVDPQRLVRLCADMARRGCDGVVLGCTELSCVDFSLPADLAERLVVLDALDVLAWRCVQLCGAPAAQLPALTGQAPAADAAPTR